MRKYEYLTVQGSNLDTIFQTVQQKGLEGYRLHTLASSSYGITDGPMKRKGDGLFWTAILEKETTD